MKFITDSGHGQPLENHPQPEKGGGTLHAGVCLLRRLAVPLQQVFGDARGDPLGGLTHRIAREMRVARGGLDPRVAQELPDHGESLAERESPRCERMAQVMEAHFVKARARADGPPGVIELPEVRTRLPAGDHPGIAGGARESGEELHRGLRERNDPRARLGV